jgi:metacaspase-1
LLKEPDILHEAGRGLLDAVKSFSKGDFIRVITAGVSIVKSITREPETREYIRQTKTSPADVIQLSGCKNYQTSSDTVEAV